MKKIATVFIVLLLLSTFVFAGGKKEKSSVPEVAVSLPGSVEFFSVERKGMDAAAKEFGLKLVYADAEWDAGKQLNQVENFVAKGVDMVLLCAADNQHCCLQLQNAGKQRFLFLHLRMLLETDRTGLLTEL